MSYNDLVTKAKTYFPNLQIKFKDKSIFMKILGKILFFNPNFMKSYTTTIGNTIYVPNEKFISDNPQNFEGILIHECTHMYDEKKFSILFSWLYLFPQILSLPTLALLFFLSWKIVLPIFVLLLLPWPAPWRTYFEKRAYFVHMYAMNQLVQSNPITMASHFAPNFKNGSYYWMWILGQEKSFEEEAAAIMAGHPLCANEPELYQMVNDLITSAKQ